MTTKRFLARDGIDGNSKSITNVADPTNAQDAATKAFSSNATNLTTGILPAARLPFTPVQQGGGANQGTNKIYIGWSTSVLNLQVDNSDFANTWPIGVSGNAATATAAKNSSFFTAQGASEGQVGARFSGQQDVYMYNNGTHWGMYSAAGGSAFQYTRSSGLFSFNGNANTASKLQTARQINGTDFDGSANISLINSAEVNGAMAVNDGSASQVIRNINGASGDAGLAMQAFLAQGAYGIKLGVRADGYFGLGGWSRATWSWYSAPNGDMVAAGNVTAYSDPLLKENVYRIQGAVASLQTLDGVYFTWKHGIPHVACKAGKRDLGVLADQVEALFPEAVSRSIELDGESYRTVAYEKLVPVLIEAVKELKNEIDELRSQLNRSRFIG